MKYPRTSRDMAVCAMIAALYAALCLALSPLSYGMFQIRAAEALSILPVFSPAAVWGLTLGCAVSNLVGLITGANPLIFDVLLGTFATCCAAILSWKFRNIRGVYGLPVLSAVPPVLVNGLVIGLELMYLETSGTFSLAVFALNAFNVCVGQAISCFGLGLPLACLLERTGVARKCFGAYDIL